jgi:putative hydrolase
MPWLGDLARLFASQGPVSWDVARQLAHWMATEGEAEANVDPTDRMRLEELARVAELHVSDHTGLRTATTGTITVVPVTRSEWARRGLDAYRPLLERLAASMAIPGDPDEGTAPDEESGLLGGLAQMLSPVLLGMQAGFMLGHLARRALGQYDLPIPRPPSDELLVVPANLAAFAEEWSLPLDDVRLWVVLSEITHHAVLSRPHVQERLTSLLLEYAGGFEPDASAMETRLGDIDPSDPSSFQAVLGDPEALLGAMQSQAQRQLIPRIEALTAVVEGFVDELLDAVGRRLISSYAMLSEALRRRRVETALGDRYVARLLGLELGQTSYERGTAFVRGVVEREPDALARLWSSERELPTQAEVDAPGLWLARIDLVP